MKDILVYIGVKALLRAEGKFLILQHYKGGTDLPGGKVQHIDNIESELKREVKEETNLDIKVAT